MYNNMTNRNLSVFLKVFLVLLLIETISDSTGTALAFSQLRDARPSDSNSQIYLPLVMYQMSAPYTGLPILSEEYSTHPIFICINNDEVGHLAQYGLSKADVIYEYLINEATLTRFTALFQSQSPGRVGPVSSARMVNFWMTSMYDGVLAGAGGPDGIRFLLKYEVSFPYLDADIDDPQQNKYFFGVGNDYRTRLQTTPQLVNKWLDDEGHTTEWNRSGFSFSTVPSEGSSQASDNVIIPYPQGSQVEWRYDANKSGYLRFQNDRQHLDQLTGEAIVSQNIIVIFAEHRVTNIVVDSLGTKGLDITLYGSGKQLLFRDGLVYEGTWEANDVTPPRWLDGDGNEIVLKPGQSWIQVVQTTDVIQY